MAQTIAPERSRPELPHAPIDPTRAPFWATVLLIAQAIACELDYGKLGIPRFPVTVVTCLAPIPLLAWRSERLIDVLRRPPQRAAVLWLAWCTLTIAWSVVPRSTTVATATVIGLWATATWFTATYGFARFARVFTIAMCVFLTAGLVRDLRVLSQNASLHRFDGYGVFATDIGRVALLTAVLCVMQLTDRKARGPIVWWGLSVSVLALVLTGTRTTMIGLVVCLLVIAWKTIGPGRTVAVALAAAAVVAVAFSFIPEPTEFVSHDDDGQDFTSVNGRIEIWSATVDAIEVRPAQGYGVLAGELVLPLASQAGDLPILVTHAHNMVLELVMTTGMIGFALFVVAIVSLLRSPRAPVDRSSGVLVLAMLFSGITEAGFGRPSVLYLLLAAVATERALQPARVRRSFPTVV